MSLLELRRVPKCYGTGAAEVRALRDVDLAVERGSLVAVMGPSGPGKSTLLTIAGSPEEPTSGDVRIAGASLLALSRDAKARLRRRTIGYGFQDLNLLPGLTAEENVALPLELDAVPARKARAAAHAALERLGLEDRAALLRDGHMVHAVDDRVPEPLGASRAQHPDAGTEPRRRRSSIRLPPATRRTGGRLPGVPSCAGPGACSGGSGDSSS